ncbi:MAG: AAA family ATPase [Candidatus Izemoplasmatales bacterium]|nr:AAA family ATPase [Candidatus Izemoplasmatales bacterium]
MLKRKIDSVLIEWKNKDSKKALLVKGARQVGKSTSIQMFGKNNYKSFIELNFEKNPEYKEIFAGSLDANSIIINMSALGLGPFIEKETLIFLDEVQSCPKARAAIKFLVQDGRFDYIESGSLLGIHYNDVSSYPVGFEEQHNMHPLDFEEYLWAKNVNDDVINLLRNHYQNQSPIPDVIHKAIMRYFREYIIIGGLPSVVSAFIKTSDINEVLREQNSILNSYRDDVKKYSGKDKLKVQEVFDSIPEQLSKKNKRYFLSMLSKEPKMRTYEDSIMWLIDASIAIPSYNLASIELPLSLNEKRNLFKIYMFDTGLLTSMSYEGIQFEILNGDLKINVGSIIENALAVAFNHKGIQLRYYDRKKPTSMELDFVLQINNKIAIIESKSGIDFSKHPSFNRILEEKNIDTPIVYCTSNIKRENNILYLPYYLAFLL